MKYRIGGFFFFQAEDGIRDADVTGVQTCALPILNEYHNRLQPFEQEYEVAPGVLVKIGRASCRERVEISVVAVSLKKKKKKSSRRKRTTPISLRSRRKASTSWRPERSSM